MSRNSYLSVLPSEIIERVKNIDNIYKNLLKFKHIDKKPNHGCLDFS